MNQIIYSILILIIVLIILLMFFYYRKTTKETFLDLNCPQPIDWCQQHQGSTGPIRIDDCDGRPVWACGDKSGGRGIHFKSLIDDQCYSFYYNQGDPRINKCSEAAIISKLYQPTPTPTPTPIPTPTPPTPTPTPPTPTSSDSLPNQCYGDNRMDPNFCTSTDPFVKTTGKINVDCNGQQKWVCGRTNGITTLLNFNDGTQKCEGKQYDVNVQKSFDKLTNDCPIAIDQIRSKMPQVCNRPDNWCTDTSKDQYMLIDCNTSSLGVPQRNHICFHNDGSASTFKLLDGRCQYSPIDNVGSTCSPAVFRMSKKLEDAVRSTDFTPPKKLPLTKEQIALQQLQKNAINRQNNFNTMWASTLNPPPPTIKKAAGSVAKA